MVANRRLTKVSTQSSQKAVEQTEPARPRWSKLSRSEVVSVRLDPKLRYLAELAARKQRRTVSSFIEAAVEESLRKMQLDENRKSPRSVVHEGEELLWDVDDADRFAKLAVYHPELLLHDEQILWKLIQETPSIWLSGKAKPEDVVLATADKTLDLLRLRKQWRHLKSAAKEFSKRRKDWQE